MLIQKACLSSQFIDKTYVYCSNEEVRDYIVDGAEYFKRPTSLRVGIKPCIHEVDKIESRDIDYPMDFEIANTIFMNILKERG